MLSEEMRRFIDDHRVARLATANRDAQPHVIPLCYALLDDDLYFVIDDKPKRTHRELARLRNIRENSRVALVIDDYDDDWSRLAYLMLRGDAVVVATAETFDRVLQALRLRYPQYREMALSFESHPMVRIRIEHAKLWRADSDSARQPR